MRAAEFSRKSFLRASRMNELRKEHILNLCSTTKDSNITFGQLEFYVRLCDLRTKTILNVKET